MHVSALQLPTALNALSGKEDVELFSEIAHLFIIMTDTFLKDVKLI